LSRSSKDCNIYILNIYIKCISMYKYVISICKFVKPTYGQVLGLPPDNMIQNAGAESKVRHLFKLDGVKPPPGSKESKFQL